MSDRELFTQEQNYGPCGFVQGQQEPLAGVDTNQYGRVEVFSCRYATCRNTFAYSHGLEKWEHLSTVRMLDEALADRLLAVLREALVKEEFLGWLK